MQRPQREQQHGPDHRPQHARRCQRETEDAQCRQPGDAGLAAQELQVAEQVVQAQPPRDGAQRQVVARQLDGDGAQAPRDQEGQHQAQNETQPGHERRRKRGQRTGRGGRGADPGRGVGADRDEGRLSEGGHAADTGEHDQPRGHQRVEGDVAEDGGAEVREEGPDHGQRDHEQECEVAAGHARLPARMHADAALIPRPPHDGCAASATTARG